MGCCKLCEKLSKINWLIKLKIQMITLSNFGLLRKDVIIYRKKMISFIDTQYLTAKRNYDRIPTCESPDYDLVSVKRIIYCNLFHFLYLRNYSN